MVIDPDAFSWTDLEWRGIHPVFVHPFTSSTSGQYTPEGTFDAIIPRLDSLAGDGGHRPGADACVAVPGRRNWGYDGVYPLSRCRKSYGGPEGLKLLVDACHRRGLAVVLDVVYNHLGPEGNYSRLRPLFQRPVPHPMGARRVTSTVPTATKVRRYFLENALRWSPGNSVWTRCASTRSTHNGLQRLAVFSAQLAEAVGDLRK